MHFDERIFVHLRKEPAMIRATSHPVPRTIALGALLFGGFPSYAATTEKPVTFSNQVVRIFQEKCQECHRAGTVAPMSLVTYEETRPWARSIKQRVLARNMPPWHIDKTYGVRHFSNDMSLTDEELQAIVKWVDAGAPQGDPKDLPPLKNWPNDDGWLLSKQMGQPDLVLKSEPYTMQARSQDQWWRPLTQINLTEPRWVRAVEMRPGTNAGRRITHHALAHLVQDDPDARRFSDPVGSGRSPNEAGTLMEWAIGKNYDVYREGTGKLLLPGSHIWWDIHYHAVGEAIRDHVELAVWFYPKGQEPKYRTYLTGFQAVSRVGAPLDIPPNSISASDGFTVLKAPARLENYQPHMHLRGKAMAMEAILPDGTIQPIANVGNFEFNWMTNYIFADEDAPVLPKGTVIHLKAWFDNTAGHRGNPDPEQWVGWGDRTVDEMAHAWVNVTYISEEDYDQWAAKHKRPAPAPRGPTQ
jgi:mono/diheme cytochrome c family protein